MKIFWVKNNNIRELSGTAEQNIRKALIYLRLQVFRLNYLRGTKRNKMKGSANMTDQQHAAYIYLNRIGKLNQKINMLEQRYEQMRESAMNAGALRYDKDPVQCSPEDKLSRIVCDYLTLNDHINEEIDRLAAMKVDAVGVIRIACGESEQRVLIERCVYIQSVKAVASVINIQPRSVFRIQSRALQQLGEYLSKESCG